MLRSWKIVSKNVGKGGGNGGRRGGSAYVISAFKISDEDAVVVCVDGERLVQ